MLLSCIGYLYNAALRTPVTSAGLYRISQRQHIVPWNPNCSLFDFVHEKHTHNETVCTIVVDLFWT